MTDNTPQGSQEQEVAPKKRRRTAAKPPKVDLGGLDAAARSFLLMSLRASEAKREEWRGLTAVPPGTIIEQVLDQFHKNTSIPLEVPFFTLMHYMSGYLIKKKVHLRFRGDDYGADFWTMVLTTSGAGKTFTESSISNGLGAVVPRLQTTGVSAARFIEELSEQPQGLWIQDEFYNRIMKELDRPNSPLAALRGYLLSIYDNKAVGRSTKGGKDSVFIEEPVLSILGYNAVEPFIEGVTIETMTDGLAQRFGYVLTKPDPNRNWKDYPHWDIQTDEWEKMWADLVKDIKPFYTASESATKAYDYAFKTLAHGSDVDESFYRRIMFRAHKYALVYHILRGQAGNPLIDAEDYGWAVRVIKMQLADAAELIGKVGGSDLKKQLDQAQVAIEKLRAAGEKINARALIRKCSQIKNAATAKYIMDLLGVSEL